MGERAGPRYGFLELATYRWQLESQDEMTSPGMSIDRQEKGPKAKSQGLQCKELGRIRRASKGRQDTDHGTAEANANNVQGWRSDQPGQIIENAKCFSYLALHSKLLQSMVVQRNTHLTHKASERKEVAEQ